MTGVWLSTTFNNFTVLRSELAKKQLQTMKGVRLCCREEDVPLGPFPLPTGLPVPMRCRSHLEIVREWHAGVVDTKKTGCMF